MGMLIPNPTLSTGGGGFYFATSFEGGDRFGVGSGQVFSSSINTAKAPFPLKIGNFFSLLISYKGQEVNNADKDLNPLSFSSSDCTR